MIPKLYTKLVNSAVPNQKSISGSSHQGGNNGRYVGRRGLLAVPSNEAGTTVTATLTAARCYFSSREAMVHVPGQLLNNGLDMTSPDTIPGFCCSLLSLNSFEL
ncbi:hypothetical protein J6590_053423 [Homalodisca vitripennis]|nr:hypothetical protein J6590_053423 [Homalodisca vitripennis]